MTILEAAGLSHHQGNNCWLHTYRERIILVSSSMLRTPPPPCSEQLRDKSISHGFHILRNICAWLRCTLKYSVWENAFCVVFHARFSNILIPLSSQVTLVGIWESWRQKSISHGKPYKMHNLASFIETQSVLWHLNVRCVWFDSNHFNTLFQ